MSGKLDQSLDQIMTDSKVARGRKGGKPRPRRAAAAKAKAAIAAPTGGIQKNTKAAKAITGRGNAAVTPTLPVAKESKIIVSNLPEDVGEAQIKDYFTQTIGPIRRVMLTYGPNGRSRGVATIIFSKPESATKSAKELHGVKVDDKPMRIEVVVGAQYAPAPKSLAERASLPKSAATTKTNGPKNAAKDKSKSATDAATTNGTNKTARGKKAGRNSRPKKKTAAELDAEMVDYFGVDGNTANAAAAAAPAAAAPAAPAGGEAAMVDEVM